VINDSVYDCTEYLELHPGGVDSKALKAGVDATDDVMAIHSKMAQKMLENYFIGRLDTDSKEVEESLQAKTVLSHDYFMLDFVLSTPEHVCLSL